MGHGQVSLEGGRLAGEGYARRASLFRIDIDILPQIGRGVHHQLTWIYRPPPRSLYR